MTYHFQFTDKVTEAWREITAQFLQLKTGKTWTGNQVFGSKVPITHYTTLLPNLPHEVMISIHCDHKCENV